MHIPSFSLFYVSLSLPMKGMLNEQYANYSEILYRVLAFSSSFTAFKTTNTKYQCVLAELNASITKNVFFSPLIPLLRGRSSAFCQAVK